MKITVGNYYRTNRDIHRQFVVKALSNEKVYRTEEVFDGVEIDFEGNEIHCTYRANCFTELTHEEVRVLENNLLTSNLIKSQDEKPKENPNGYEDAHNTIKDLLENPHIKSITFTKSGKIKIRFAFCQNKITYETMIDLLTNLEKLEF